jgi:hypothetical protein
MGFVYTCIIFALLIWWASNKAKKMKAEKEEQARKMELARGRAIKKRMKEEAELSKYRQGIYTDDEDEEDEELFKEYDE